MINMTDKMNNNDTIWKKLLFITTILLLSTLVNAQKVDIKAVFSDAEKQTDVMIKEVPAARNGKANLVSPRTVDANGQLVLSPSFRWTSGFFPGELWYLYAYTGNKKWEEQARIFTDNIKREQFNGGTHDMGFKMYCSYGNGYLLTKDEMYKKILLQSAKTLSTRFNNTVGCFRSWDTMPKFTFPVIIDNMLNLELMFEATKLSGDSMYYKMAVSHANTTMKNHFRKDYSCYHVVDYDSTKSGNIIKKVTHQGYADESAWARGQAWAIYGFTMCYRETKDPKYLKQAENVAGYILNNPTLPADLVPYWDFNAPNIPNEPRDASAAACMASGLYELSTYSKKGNIYRMAADKMMESLTHNYRSTIGENRGFILLHSTGAKPHNSEVDAPLPYADYYYLEALLRAKKLKEGKKLF